MNYQTILFDLDGTLTDSGEGILNSVTYALETLDVVVPERRLLQSFIGPPLRESFIEKIGLSQQQAEEAVDHYRVYFKDRGLFENAVYDGVPQMLGQLKQAGCRLYVATSKPEVFAKQIIAHFDLEGYFEQIYGASMDGSRSHKGDVIAYALQRADIDRRSALMVGDREHDMLGARANGLSGLGVLYGFGNETELLQAGAIHLADSPEQVYEWLASST